MISSDAFNADVCGSWGAPGAAAGAARAQWPWMRYGLEVQFSRMEAQESAIREPPLGERGRERRDYLIWIA